MHNKQNARKNKQEGKTHAKSLAWHFKICGGMEMKDQGNKKGKERWGVPTFPTSSGSTFPTIFLFFRGPHFLQFYRLRVPHFLQYFRIRVPHFLQYLIA